MPPRAPRIKVEPVVRMTRARAAQVVETAVGETTTVVKDKIVVDKLEVDSEPAKKKRKVTPKKPKAKVLVAPGVPRSPRTPPPPFVLSDAVTHLSGVDARFASLFTRVPCRPFVEAAAIESLIAGDPAEQALRSVDPFRSLVTSIIGQQVSWMAARSITKRFVEFFCGTSDEGEARRGDGPFPTREQVANADVPSLKSVGLSTRKAEYVIELAQHFVAGRLSDEFLFNGTDEEVAEALIAVRGIGRWTVDMFLIFTLKRTDVLPVGDLGVQKGLLRWVLAAHGALPEPQPKTPKTPKKSASQSVVNTPPATPTKTLTQTASSATLIDDPLSQTLPATPSFATPSKASTAFPSTPGPPPVTPSASTNPTLPAPLHRSILTCPHDWDDTCAHRAAPLPDGLNVSTLRSRLAGKKAKGGVYLLPEEMEALTEAWRPYRSLGVYYTWTMAGESPNDSAP